MKFGRASMPPLKSILRCGADGNENEGHKNGAAAESEPFETMESVQVAEIDDYLEALLKRCNKSHGYTGINFMESPRSSNI